VKLPPVIVPYALITPPVEIFPALALPVIAIVLIIETLPTSTFPATDKEVRTPSDVIFGCAALATFPAVLANAGIDAKFASS
jgi:hypothetical protein